MPANEVRLSAERAIASVLGAAFGGLLACLGGWLGVMRVLSETYRSCPTGLEEAQHASVAIDLGSVAVLMLVATTVASLWGLIQGVRRRSHRPALVSGMLGAITLGFGIAAALIPQTTMC
jgi:threonine/homoserine/homoserine lactone efflux protein